MTSGKIRDYKYYGIREVFEKPAQRTNECMRRGSSEDRYLGCQRVHVMNCMGNPSFRDCMGVGLISQDHRSWKGTNIQLDLSIVDPGNPMRPLPIPSYATLKNVAVYLLIIYLY